MTYCQSCGSPVEGRFCAKCGAASPTPEYPGPPPTGTGMSIMADNVASALSYVPLLGGALFLLVEPYNRNKLIRFHAFQALFLFAAMIVTNILFNNLFVLYWSFWQFYQLIQWAFFAVFAYAAYKAYSGAKVVLPVIGPLAEKQA